GKLLPRYLPDPGTSPAFIEVFALYLLLYVVLGVTLRIFGLVSLNWYWLAWLILPVTILWAAHRGNTFIDSRKAFGWYSGAGWGREVAAGVAGYLACIPFIAVALVITS